MYEEKRISHFICKCAMAANVQNLSIFNFVFSNKIAILEFPPTLNGHRSGVVVVKLD